MRSRLCNVPLAYIGTYWCTCRNREEPEYQRQAIEYYTELQQIVERLHGFDNDQNALVYKMMADTYENLAEYSK